MITNTMLGMNNIKFEVLFLRRKDMDQREIYGWVSGASEWRLWESEEVFD